jgi:hypothetical protein
VEVQGADLDREEELGPAVDQVVADLVQAVASAAARVQMEV